MDPIGSVYAQRERRRSLLPSASAAIVVASLAAFAIAPSCSRDAPRPPRAPNVLLISLDSLRADHLGCYRYRSRTGAPTSAHLDRLAGDGVLFEHAISTTSWTMPSHHALFSGIPDLLHGAISDGSAPTPRRVQLAQVLADAGYATAGFYSGPYLKPLYGFGGGFEPGAYENVSGVEEKLHAPSAAEIESGYHHASSAKRVSDRAIAWLDDHRGARAQQPFFLFLHYFDVHYDYAPPEEGFARHFWPDGRRPRLDGDSFFENPQIRPGMAPDDLAGVVSYYDGEIQWTDEQVGRVLDRLGALGIEDDTLVVVVSDHGDEFLEHGAKGHRQNLFGSTLDVALIARLPGRLPAGKRIAQRVSLVDVAPTILDLAGALDRADAYGLDVPLLEHGMWGRTLLPLVEGRESADRDCLGFLANRWQDPDHPVDTWALWTGAMKVIVTKRYDWIRNDAGEQVGLKTIARSGLVFDLAADPGELRPLQASRRGDVEGAIRRFDELFAADGGFARLMGALPAGAKPEQGTPEEIEAERKRLRELGYTQGPAGTLPPPPQFPREQ